MTRSSPALLVSPRTILWFYIVVLLLSPMAIAQSKPDITQLLREHNFVAARNVVLQYWPQNPQAANSSLRKIRQQEAHELNDLMNRAKQQYEKASHQRNKGYLESAKGHN